MNLEKLLPHLRAKTWITLASVTVMSGAWASELVNSTEQTKLDTINSEYSTRYNEVGLDDTISLYNKTSSSIEANKIKLLNSLDIIKADSQVFQEKLLQGEYDEGIALALRGVSTSINKLNTELADAETKLKELNKTIASNQASVTQIERDKNDQLLALYRSIKDRHLKEANEVHREDYSGKLECKVTESLSACVNRNLPYMKNAFALEKGGSERINLTSYKVVDATQKLNGDLTYTVSAEYKNAFNSNLEGEIRKALNLDKIRFVFRSNSATTDYYINDEKVGSGDVIELSGNYVGVYNVKAVNNGKTQSLRLNLKNDGDYFFPFAKKTQKKAAAKPAAVTTKSAKKNEAAQITKKVLNDPQTAKVKKSPKQEVGTFSNTVVYKDEVFTYLYPVYRGNNKSAEVFLSRDDATQYCEQKLSSKLPTKAAYKYLELYADLKPGDYWTDEGTVYSAQKKDVFDKTFDTNRFICMVSMTN
ncbi:hypothetical protein [Vibrio sp. 10N]|uniref:hypothetical protein n=1 Tax=Vibrio sp. 10N TaxID=3058938 RepID=UPI0028144B57|nr:hypothetical protein VB10N_13720 [Vibrio sp. 10N]